MYEEDDVRKLGPAVARILNPVLSAHLPGLVVRVKWEGQEVH